MRATCFRPCLIVLLALGGACLARMPAPLILYNHSPSVPIGFYVRVARPPRLGDFVTVRARDVAAHYARQRHFDEPGDLFIKRVGAKAGARVCANGDYVTVASLRLMRHEHDNAGRVLPRWRGCRLLRRDELFLVGDTPDSFDARYWGPVSVAHIEGVWRPI